MYLVNKLSLYCFQKRKQEWDGKGKKWGREWMKGEGGKGKKYEMRERGGKEINKKEGKSKGKERTIGYRDR